MPVLGKDCLSVAATLRSHAQEFPDRRACTFLANGTVESETLTYSGLDRRARRIAARLQELMAPGDRAVLLYPPGLELIAALFGCFQAGVVAVPSYPPRPHRANTRLRTIVQESQPAMVLTTSPILARREPLACEISQLAAVCWAATDALEDGLVERWWPAPLDPESVALLQYTSGSTADPKGVMVSHRNFLANERLIQSLCGHTEATIFVGWLPLYHDMGLMGNVLQPLFVGGHCVLMAPSAFLQRPVRWLEAITRYRATTSGGPNFAYDLCVDRIAPEQRAGLDLASWSVAFNGSEPVRADTLERFAAAFAPHGFRRKAFFACYGMAEATLMVTGSDLDRPAVTAEVDGAALAGHRVATAPAGAPGSRRLVSSGRVAGEHRVLIVDPVSREACSGDRVGEIWVAGPSVAGGYWDRPEQTAATFRAELAGAPGREVAEIRWLRTGDLGFVTDGELFVTGRLKDLVIIRGQNHYPQDIELTAERSHPALLPGSSAAFAVDLDGKERLVVVVERQPRSRDGVAQVAPAVRGAVVAEHHVQIHALVLARAGAVPKTTSGKVRRSACRELFLAGELESFGTSMLEAGKEAGEWSGEAPTREELLALDPSARRESLEGFLRQEVGRVLRLAPGDLDLAQPLTGLGLDSLGSFELEHAIQQELGIGPPLDLLLGRLSIADLVDDLLARLASGVEAETAVRTEPTVPAGEVPLSAMQKALWFEQQMAPESPAYNVSFAARLEGGVNAAALRRAFAELVARHPALRTTLAVRDGAPVGRVAAPGDLPFDRIWEEVDAVDADAEEVDALVASAAHRPFDLAAGPLLRVVLFSRSTGPEVDPEVERSLLIAAHHTVIDGWSLWVLLDELRLLYAATAEGRPADLSPAVDAGEFAIWQKSLLSGPEGERLWRFWQAEMAGEPVLDLPFDHARSPERSRPGGACSFALDQDLVGDLRAVAHEAETTLYTALLGAYIALLARHVGRPEVVVGTPVAGRSRPDFARMVGCLFNTVALRAEVPPDLPFRDFLVLLRGKVAAALAHQDYPSPLVAERLRPGGQAAGVPFFAAQFIFQQIHPLAASAVPLADGRGVRLDLGSLVLESLLLAPRAARSPLELELIEAGSGVLGRLLYDAELFTAETAARLVRRFETLLHSVAGDPGQRLGDVDLLERDERGLLLGRFSREAGEHGTARSVHELFEAQVARTPHQPAAVHGGRSLTYVELDGQARALADFLMGLDS